MGAEAAPDSSDEIHCYRLELAACDANDLAVLDPAERDRAARFKFERDRTRYIAAHAQARRHLGARLGLAPAIVPLTTTGNGKPVVDVDAALVAGADVSAANLSFNLTHSGAVGYLAIASFSVGIDVELLRAFEDLQPLIDGYCSPAEIDALAALPGALRALGFLGVWTRKEAALKAWGTGIGVVALNELHVGTATEAIAALEMPSGMSGAGHVAAGQETVGHATADHTTADRAPASHSMTVQPFPGYPRLQLRTIVGAGQVLSLAAAIDRPPTVRMAVAGTAPLQG